MSTSEPGVTPAAAPQPKGARTSFVRFLFVIVLLLGLLFWVVGIPLRKGRELWREGNHPAAVKMLSRWSKLRLRPAEYEHSLAVAYLSSGQTAAAIPLLDQQKKRSPALFPLIRKQEVAEKLLESGSYEEFLLYDAAVRQRGGSKKIAFYRAAALVGANQLQEAEAVFRSLDEDADEAKHAALKQAIVWRKEGNVPYLLDRTGKTIATVNVAKNDLVAVNTDFSPLIDESGGLRSLEANPDPGGQTQAVLTTLDPFFQKAALYALGSTRGSIVVIDVQKNEILAIANNAGDGGATNLAFEGEYEPGSIIKVLTTLAAVDHRVDLARTFPMQCNGFLQVDNRLFRDWAAHNEVTSLNEAMAVSCNVAFAEIGRKLGGEKLRALARSAGFDSSADLGLIRVPLGKTRGDLVDEYAVANFAVGLEKLSVNALHVAMLAAAIANGGFLVTPRLVIERRSILGERLPYKMTSRPVQLAARNATQTATETMKAVVIHPRGTGRRAVVDGLTIAVKTGTAGNPAEGKTYDALIMAFAPAEKPRIAVGIIAENAGPAEILGARIAHDFFVQVKGNLGPP